MGNCLYPTEKRMDQGSVVWHCKCDCGNECDVSSRRLVRGKVRSCGCLFNPPLKDYIGKTFGRWTVVEYAGTAKDLGLVGTMNYWRCRCSCGNEGIVGQTELQNGDSQSCGCLQKERCLESLKLVDDTSIVRLETGREKLRSNNVSGKQAFAFLRGNRNGRLISHFKRNDTGLANSKIRRMPSGRVLRQRKCTIISLRGTTRCISPLRDRKSRHPTRVKWEGCVWRKNQSM